MCIAILNTPQGGLIPEDVLLSCWNSNKDGAGFAFPLAGKVEIFKELKKFKRFYKAYEIARVGYPDAYFVIHFRIKTHGHVSRANCHPFLINEKTAFAHNGMIDGFVDKEKSDTVLFMEKVLRNMPEDFLEHEGIRRLIRKSTGWSKFVFVTADNRYRIINEEAGTWDGLNWYSNQTYKTRGACDVGGRTVYSGGTTSVRDYTNYGGIGYSGSWHNKNGSGTFTESGLPVETKDDDWPEKQYARQIMNSVPVVDDIEDALPFRTPEKEKRNCSECYQELFGRMEHHYGVCTKCLRDYEIIPHS